ncbi:serine/threonine-protein kinase [Actinomadura madurae]|uniref:serine/threonine-protein kinase n=1 Tax=Actinomadura madurae TaxID=1993 RepID=UPI0020270397|nr:serine/threonine-protein kinase [Actinomadura madurae]URM95432.1 serine/threonine-protein kinase [Actinomadura madurae]
MTTIAGRYELDPVHIGKGGMGEVWGATDTRLRRRVAVKLVRFADDPELIRRFVRESQLTARMAHPGVPVLYDADKVSGGPFDGRLYLVMELVEGINVDDLVAEHDPLPIGWAAAIAAQVCAVLSYAHGKSLVHRDLKPSNLMVDKDGAVKVLDFGLAVALDADERSRLTSTNQTLGTLAYMSPEQFRGRSGPSSDLYALGCVLYQMLTGQSPFNASDHVSYMHAHIYEEAVAVGNLRADVPPELDALVRRLLAKAPEARPASADEAFDALHPYTSGLRELPGAVRSGRSPLRMYADVAGRTLAAYSSPAALAPPQPPAKPSPADSFSLGDVARARRSAERLMRESRFEEAARALSRTSARAESVLGGDHSEVIALRTELADVYYQAGDYAAAASAFHTLAEDAARRDGGGSETVFGLRFQEAGSRALAGEIDRALAQLRDLIGDETRLFGKDDDRVLEHRRQLGLLLHGAGRTATAVRLLEELAADLERFRGPDDRTLQAVRETLTRIKPV